MATNQETQKAKLPKPQMPTLSGEFGKNARRFQRIARMAIQVALILSCVTAVISAFLAESPHFLLLGNQVNDAAAIMAVLFLLALLLHLFRIIRDPEHFWAASRLLAERTKSLAWRYAVAGSPFSLTDKTPDDAVMQYQAQLDKVAIEAGLHFAAQYRRAEIRVITDWMAETRAKSLNQRREIYAEQRIRDQEHYYAAQERIYSLRAAQSQWMLVGMELLVTIFAGFIALGIIQLDLISIVGTVAASVEIWVLTNQYAEHSTYGAMAYRMAGYQAMCLSNAMPWTEDRWASFVSDVEAALDEELGARYIARALHHTMRHIPD